MWQCGAEMWCQSAPYSTTLPHHKRMDLLKKVINMNLLFINNKFFILNKVFDILNFQTLGTTFEPFWHHHSCSDKLPLTPHHILVICNLILAKNKKIQCGNKDLIFKNFFITPWNNVQAILTFHLILNRASRKKQSSWQTNDYFMPFCTQFSNA